MSGPGVPTRQPSSRQQRRARDGIRLGALLLALLAASADAASLAKQCRRECSNEIQVCRQGCTEPKARLRQKCRKGCKRSLLKSCRAEGLQICTAPEDPCSGAASCDRRTVDDEAVVTASTDTGYRSLITGPAGVAEIVWTVSGTSTSFQYTPPGGSPGPVVTIAGTPANAAGVSNAALLLHRSRVPAAMTLAYTGPNTLANTSGCDQLHGLDCGPIGKCCDVHDDCINQNCGGQGNCGNVLGALEAGYGPMPCPPDCLQCHGAVVKCFFDGSLPGPSDCCDDGDCGRAQECMINGRVITDPCHCRDQGIPEPHRVSADVPHRLHAQLPRLPAGRHGHREFELLLLVPDTASGPAPQSATARRNVARISRSASPPASTSYTSPHAARAPSRAPAPGARASS